MKISRPETVGIISLYFAASVLQAQTHTWVGAGSPPLAWTDATNWTPSPPPLASASEFGSLVFGGTGVSTVVNDDFTGESIAIQPLAGSFDFSGSGLLTLRGMLSHGTASTLNFSNSVTFEDFLGDQFIVLENTTSSGFNALTFSGATVVTDSTVAVQNRGNGFHAIFAAGLAGNGSLQVGTDFQNLGASVVLRGNSNFGGDLRFRAPVTVTDDGTSVGRLTGVSNVYLESPVNSEVDRAKLLFTGMEFPPFFPPDRIKDTANFLFHGGELEIQPPSSSNEMVGTMEFRHGHSAISMKIDGNSTPPLLNRLESNSIVRLAGASALVDGQTLGRIANLSSLGSETQIASLGTVPELFGTAADRSDPLFHGSNDKIVQWMEAKRIVPLDAFPGYNYGGTFVRVDPIDGITPLGDSNYDSAIDPMHTDDNVSIVSQTLMPAGPPQAEFLENSLRFMGANGGSGGLELNGNTLRIASGSLMFGADGNYAITNLVPDSGELILSRSGVLFSNQQVSGNKAEISANIRAPAGFTVSGTSPLVFSGNNIILGPVFLNQDVFLGSDGALGFGRLVKLSQDVEAQVEFNTITSNALFTYAGGNSGLSVNNGGATYTGAMRVELPIPQERASIFWNTYHSNDNSARLTVSGAITLVNPTDLVLTANDSEESSLIEVQGVLNSGFGVPSRIYARGPGLKSIDSNNAFTYWGSIFVEEGRLQLGASASISTASALTIHADATFDTTAQPVYTQPTSQSLVLGINAAGAGSSGQIMAAGLDVTNALVSFNLAGVLDDPVYVLATYTGSLTGTFAPSTIVPPGYTLEYAYQGDKIALIQSGDTPYMIWAGGVPYTGDANDDGVKNGLAWIFGAADPSSLALNKLPTATTSPDFLTLQFFRTNPYAPAKLYIEYSTDLTTWTRHEIPENTGTIPMSDIEVIVIPGPPDAMTVKIPTTYAVAGKLFARISSTEN
jgi:hypothetical protein